MVSRSTPRMDLSTLDLDLLVTLDALLEPRSVTETAQRFGITQSATSHRLARTRELFDDPLLVTAGDELVLTSKAQTLQTPLRRALQHLGQAVLAEAEEDYRIEELERTARRSRNALIGTAAAAGRGAHGRAGFRHHLRCAKGQAPSPKRHFAPILITGGTLG